MAQKLNYPVTTTLMGLGAYPSTDKQWLGMLGMHGTYEANTAMHNSDMIFAVGARFDDRVTNALDKFCPNAKIVHIDVEESLEELRMLISGTKISRVLVSEEDIDNVIGYVHHQQLFQNPSDIRNSMIPIAYLTEAMRVRDAMDYFINKQINIACVVDEYGGTSGVVTIEDIVEEIFGEIDDEHDYEDLAEMKISVVKER